MNSFYFILGLIDCAFGFAMILAAISWGWWLLFAAFCLSLGIKETNKVEKDENS